MNRAIASRHDSKESQLRIAEGTKLFHGTEGFCVVSKVREPYFWATFHGTTRQFAISTANKYFSTEYLAAKYGIQSDLSKEDRGRLEALEESDFSSAKHLIDSLSGKKEFRAVDLICERLQAAGFQLDYFLLIKHAKALRRLERSGDAIKVASNALKLADTNAERSIALTVCAAARLDAGAHIAAEADAKEAISEDSTKAHPYSVLGRLYIKLHDYTSADDYFVQACARDPGEPDGTGSYFKYTKELATKGKGAEIYQIREHIRLNWPPEDSAAALKAIDSILGEASIRVP